MAMDRLSDKIYGCLLGGLIGDAMGAPTERLHYKEIIEKYGPDGVTDFEGVGTDDTAIRDQLIDAAYGEHVYVDDRTIDSHIKRLRKKFKEVDSEFTQIETLYGIGYRYKEN